MPDASTRFTVNTGVRGTPASNSSVRPECLGGMAALVALHERGVDPQMGEDAGHIAERNGPSPSKMIEKGVVVAH